MKFILFTFVFYSFINLTSTIEELNLSLDQQEITNSSTTYESISYLQEFTDDQQDHLNNGTTVYDEDDVVINSGNAADVFINRVIHPKFRHRFHTHESANMQSSQASMEPDQRLLIDETNILNVTISSLILQTLTQGIANSNDQKHRRLSFVNYFYQKIRALIRRRHENWTRRPYSNIKTAL